MVTEDELLDLDRKLSQLRLDYERYFLGSRPREPVMLRGEVERKVVLIANGGIPNTALRFKFNSICSRYPAFKRQWNETLRKMDDGTYARHRFKADLHQRQRGEPWESPATDAPDLFAEYRDARLACGQSVAKLSRENLGGLLERQREALTERFGEGARLQFRVVVEDGRAKLKGSRVRE